MAPGIELSDFDVEKQQRRNEGNTVVLPPEAPPVSALTPSREEIVVRVIEVLVSVEPQPSEPCRVCQEDKDEALINLGCLCRGGLANAHHSCIVKWFNTRGSNKCEICRQVASNVSPPDSQAYWVWRVDPTVRGAALASERERACYSPLWVAFSILIGGLMLDVLVSVTLGVSKLPVDIIIGVIVLLGLATALRLCLEFCQDWNVRREAQRAESNTVLGYHPAL